MIIPFHTLENHYLFLVYLPFTTCFFLLFCCTGYPMHFARAIQLMDWRHCSLPCLWAYIWHGNRENIDKNSHHRGIVGKVSHTKPSLGRGMVYFFSQGVTPHINIVYIKSGDGKFSKCVTSICSFVFSFFLYHVGSMFFCGTKNYLSLWTTPLEAWWRQYRVTCSRWWHQTHTVQYGNISFNKREWGSFWWRNW
jgi:hypothetical protein